MYMTKLQATGILTTYAACNTVGELYDDHQDFADALAYLIPGFEYPEWESRTVGEILRLFAATGLTPDK